MRRTSLSSLLLLGALALPFAACGRDRYGQLADQASAQYQCTSNHITLVRRDERAHTAFLDVCGTEHGYQWLARRGWVEIPTAGGDRPRKSRPPRASATGSDVRLRTEMVVDGTSMRWLAIPARDAEHVALTIVTPTSIGGAECPVRARIEDQITELQRSGQATRDAADRTVFVSVPKAFVRELATAERAAIRACATEIQIGADERAVLTELLTRIEEERGWASPSAAPPPTSETAPATTP